MAGRGGPGFESRRGPFCRTIHYCETNQGAPTLIKLLTGHTRTIRCVQFAKHNPNLIVSSGTDGATIIWNVERESEEARLPPLPGANEGCLVDAIR